MKINWGHKIVFVYIAFVGGIVFLMIKASGEKFDLVTRDYYGEELKYQQVIDASANTAKLSAPIIISKDNGSLTVHFPEEMKGKKKQIDFYLYYPADASKDFRKSFNSDQENITQNLPKGITGNYELKLSWSTDSLKYYYEQKIFF